MVYPVQTSTSGPTKPGSIVLVNETSSGDLPNFSGPDYYNIKKPAGGYYTFKFSCTKLISKGEPSVYTTNVDRQNITVTRNSSTKDTYVIVVNNIGNFQLEILYTSEDFKELNLNTNIIEPKQTGATSPPFTLS